MVGTREDDVLRRLAAAADLETTAVQRLLEQLGYSNAVAAANNASLEFDESHLQVVIRPARSIVVM